MIDYIVNKEKRTVIAIIKFGYKESTFCNSECVFDDLWDTIHDLTKGPYFTNRREELKSKMFFPSYIVGKAKCDPEDEWDEDFGKSIARERLVEKIKKYRSDSYKIIADLVKEINDIVERN